MSLDNSNGNITLCQYQTFNISKEIFDEYKSPDGALRFLYKITHKETGLVYVGRKTAHTYKSAIEYKGSSQHDLFKNIKNQDLSLYEWEIVNYLPEGIILKYEDGTIEDFEEDLILKTKSQYGSKCVNQHSNNHWFFVKPYERTEEHKKQMSFRIKESIEKGIKVSWNKGKHLSEEDKENKRKSANKVEVKERQRQARIGRKWCNNGIEELWLFEEDLDLKLKEEGWQKGRLKKDTLKKVKPPKKERSKEHYQKPLIKEKRVKAMKETFATPESQEKRSKISIGLQSEKPMKDLDGNNHMVHKDLILEKLRLGWNLTQTRIRLNHPETRHFVVISLRGVEVNTSNMIRKTIRLLESGYVFGCKSRLVEETPKATREYCDKRKMWSLF